MSAKLSSGTPLSYFGSLNGLWLCLINAIAVEFILNAFFDRTHIVEIIARIGVVFLSLYTVHRFASVAFRLYRPSFKDLICLSLVIIGSVGVVWLGRVISLGLATYVRNANFAGSLSSESLWLAIPYGAGGLLLQAVLGLHVALVFAVSFALIIGVYFPSEPLMVLYVLATNLVAGLSLSHFRARSAYTRAGFNVALMCLPFALASVALEPAMGGFDIAVRISGAVISGVFCTFLAAGVTPIVEYLGGYVTDMRLLEMATLDHPLLKELSIQAPGTWNHSMVMGMMVEAAADAIDGNPVLARVGAYFHDIGKMKKPLYFVENQMGEENRHDKLSTTMSALIIKSHVKDGIELARKHNLPKVIEDMIPQHHGTAIIEYFYEKARKEAEEAGEDPEAVDVSIYTYPGPRPQTREAGVLMLADGIEAAARTLSDPSHDRIQGMVQKMINKVFASGELSECDLTLRNLHAIAKCFTRVLSAIYHQRIAYAEPAEKVSEKSIAREDAVADVTNTEKPSAGEALSTLSSDAEPNGEIEEEKQKENLKRLGIEETV